MECILRMCIDLLALQLLAAPSAGGGASAAAGASGAAGADASAPAGGVHADQEPAQSPAAADPSTGGSGDGGPGGAEDTRSKSLLPSLMPADFGSLQSHADDLGPRERQDWLRAAKFLQTALKVRPGHMWRMMVLP